MSEVTVAQQTNEPSSEVNRRCLLLLPREALTTAAAGKHVCDKCTIRGNDRVSIYTIWSCYTNMTHKDSREGGAETAWGEVRQMRGGSRHNKT